MGILDWGAKAPSTWKIDGRLVDCASRKSVATSGAVFRNKSVANPGLFFDSNLKGEFSIPPNRFFKEENNSQIWLRVSIPWNIVPNSSSGRFLSINLDRTSLDLEGNASYSLGDVPVISQSVCDALDRRSHRLRTFLDQNRDSRFVAIQRNLDLNLNQRSLQQCGQDVQRLLKCLKSDGGVARVEAMPNGITVQHLLVFSREHLDALISSDGRLTIRTEEALA